MSMFVALLAAVMAACTNENPYNSLRPAGPVAEKQDGLFVLVFWIAVVVFILVEGALLYALFRYRRRSASDTPTQLHGNTRLEVIWTIIPALILAGIAVPTVGTIFDLAEAPPDSMRIEVTGHQFWWEISYPDLGVVTANEAHIPTGEQVVFELTSDDVIHSWWVPRLAGKMDLVPGRTNEMNLAAEEPGTYRGQCAEFCGLGHAQMRFRVIAHEPADFDAWVEQQRAEAAAIPPAEIEQIVTGTCMSCHQIAGLESPVTPQQPAPDLTHFGDRQTIAAGMLPNTPEELARWLRDPPAVKPGSKMPDYDLTEPQIEAMVEYLESLE